MDGYRFAAIQSKPDPATDDVDRYASLSHWIAGQLAYRRSTPTRFDRP